MRGKWRAQRADRGAHAARSFVGGAALHGGRHALFTASFNAARGFVGGAAIQHSTFLVPIKCFNAARGFVGGAASSLSAIVPLRGKRPLGKSPEI